MVVDDVVELVELDDVLLDVVVVGGDVLLELVVVDDELEELEVVGGIVLIIHHPSMSCLSSLVPRYWSWLLLC